MSTYAFDLDGTLDISPALRQTLSALRAAGHRCIVVTGNTSAVSILSSLGLVVDGCHTVGPVDHSAEKVAYLQSISADFLFDNDISNVSAAAAAGIPGAVFVPTAQELKTAPTPQRSKRTGTGIFPGHLDLDLQRMKG